MDRKSLKKLRKKSKEIQNIVEAASKVLKRANARRKQVACQTEPTNLGPLKKAAQQTTAFCKNFRIPKVFTKLEDEILLKILVKTIKSLNNKNLKKVLKTIKSIKM
jgi:hypothetical protein